MKKIIIMGILILALCTPMAFAGFFDIWDSITGKATSGTSSAAVTIGNTGPSIITVYTTASVNPSEGPSSTLVNFYFLASDPNGVSDINVPGYATLSINSTGEITRSNSSCTPTNINTTAVNFTCGILMWWYDANAVWSVNASVRDASNVVASNATTTYSNGQTIAMKVGPTNITWASISTSSTNVLSDVNMTINNTGNYNVASGKINVTSFNLQGNTTTTEYINSTYFSVNVNYACEGDALANATEVVVSSSVAAKGNYTINDGTAQEKLYFCIETVPSGISAQTYNSISPWIIEVS
jgi:hypothetical protein